MQAIDHLFLKITENDYQRGHIAVGNEIIIKRS